jgi:hypothetical protein
MSAAITFAEFRDDLVTSRSSRAAAKQLGEFQILPLRAFLPAADGQFGVACSHARLVH